MHYCLVCACRYVKLSLLWRKLGCLFHVLHEVIREPNNRRTVFLRNSPWLPWLVPPQGRCSTYSYPTIPREWSNSHVFQYFSILTNNFLPTRRLLLMDKYRAATTFPDNEVSICFSINHTKWTTCGTKNCFIFIKDWESLKSRAPRKGRCADTAARVPVKYFF